MRHTSTSAAVIICGLLALSSCGSNSDSAKTNEGKLTVGVAFYPIEEVARNVGGQSIDIVSLVPPGEEAHEYEPTPQQVASLEKADIVLYLGNGFQPNVEKAISSLPDSVIKIDLLKGITLLPISGQLPGVDGETDGEALGDGNDPHVWLDPSNMQTMTDDVAKALSAADSSLAATFTANAKTYDNGLAALDQELGAGLAACASPFIVTSHRAFEYLAQAYGLTQIAIAGISPDEEPSAKTLEAVAAFAQDNDVSTIFFETNLPADLSKTVANEIGATVDVLDPVETLSDDQLQGKETYISVMKENLASLRTGLGCS